MKSIAKYYGAKYKLAKHYGPPSRRICVEPFAGFAGYSLYWDWPDTILVEKNPVIANIWKYLIHDAVPADINAVPDDAHTMDMVPGPDPLKHLVSFWFGRGDCRTRPRMTQKTLDMRANGNGNFWGPEPKRRIIDALPLIQRWQIIHGDYTDAPDSDDTYTFIDPPYQVEGTEYKFGCKQLDFQALGSWCRQRQCAVVCESSSADWLPFEKLVTMTSQSGGKYDEVVWRTPGSQSTPAFMIYED